MAKETTTAGKADTQSFRNWGQERTEVAKRPSGVI